MIEYLINLFIEHFNNNVVFSGAILVSMFITAMGSVLIILKVVPNTLYERAKRALIYKVSVEETDELYSYVEKWFASNHSKSYRNVEATLLEVSDKYDGPLSDMTPESGEEPVRYSQIFYKHFEDSFLIFYHGCPIYVFKGREKLENASSMRQLFFNRYSFSGIMAKKAIMAMLEEIREHNVKLIDKKKIRAFINDEYGTWQKISDITPKPLESVILKDKNMIISDIQKFIHNRKWYLDRAITYKRGYRFYGPPGNGKTTLCSSLAKEFERDIYYLSISELKSDSGLKRAFMGLTRKSMLVIEDIDGAFKGRESNDEVTFSAILNCLDGNLYPEDVITIITTNHPENMDQALIREGRIDVHIEFPNPSKKEVEEYLSVFYEQDIMLEGYSPKFSMAKVQDLCLRNIESPEKVAKQLNIETLDHKEMVIHN